MSPDWAPGFSIPAAVSHRRPLCGAPGAPVTVHGNTSPSESEEQQDEEAEERFDDESLNGTPSTQADDDDPDDSPEQPNDEA